MNHTLLMDLNGINEFLICRHHLPANFAQRIEEFYDIEFCLVRTKFGCQLLLV